jgi:hypothetical protein
VGNLDSGLQVQGKTGEYRNGFLENCKDLQTIKVRNEVIRENMGITQPIFWKE